MAFERLPTGRSWHHRSSRDNMFGIFYGAMLAAIGNAVIFGCIASLTGNRWQVTFHPFFPHAQFDRFDGSEANRHGVRIEVKNH